MQETRLRLTPQNKRPLFEHLYRDTVEKWFVSCQDLELIVRPYQSKRTLEQNRRLWAIYRQIADGVWVNGKRYDSQTWHEYFKREFIGQIDLPNGQTMGISTTTLNTAQMAEYQEKICAWVAQEHGVTIHDF